MQRGGRLTTSSPVNRLERDSRSLLRDLFVWPWVSCGCSSWSSLASGPAATAAVTGGIGGNTAIVSRIRLAYGERPRRPKASPRFRSPLAFTPAGLSPSKDADSQQSAEPKPLFWIDRSARAALQDWPPRRGAPGSRNRPVILSSVGFGISEPATRKTLPTPQLLLIFSVVGIPGTWPSVGRTDERAQAAVGISHARGS